MQHGRSLLFMHGVVCRQSGSQSEARCVGRAWCQSHSEPEGGMGLWYLRGATMSQLGAQRLERWRTRGIAVPKEGRRVKQFRRARCVKCSVRSVHERARCKKGLGARDSALD